LTQQAVFRAVNNGDTSGDLSSFRTFTVIDMRTTAVDNKPDNGLVALGYHYDRGAFPVAQNVAVATPVPFSTNQTGMKIVITPTNAGQILGKGMRLLAKINSAPAGSGFDMPSSAGLQLDRTQLPLIDLGNGSYELRFATGANTGTISVDFTVDGELFGPLDIPVN